MGQKRRENDVQNVMETLSKNTRLIEPLLDGGKTKGELADRLGVSSQTIYRRMRQLQALHLIERTSMGYEFTEIGRCHADIYLDLCTRSEQIFEIGNLLSEYPGDDLPSLKSFIGAEVVPSQRYSPHSPRQQIETIIEQANVLKILSPIIRPEYVEAVANGQETRGQSASIVVEKNVVEYVQSQDAEIVSQLLAVEDVTIRQTESTLPFELFISDSDGEVGVVVLDTRGNVAGVLLSQSQQISDWAHEYYHRHETEAIELTNVESANLV